MKLQIKAEYKDDFVDIGTIETHPAVGGVFVLLCALLMHAIFLR